jgi:hypothetical protein
MSCEALLATPARPLYEPSHRPPKKDRPKSLSFCSDNTVTDDQQAARERDFAIRLRIDEIETVCLAGIQENHEYPSQFASYLGDPHKNVI